MTGKKLYSNTLGNWHIWLTFWGQMLSSAYWMIDGLRGSPRRFAVPLPKYDRLNELAVVAVVILVIGQLLFVYNMIRTLQGAGGVVVDPEDVEGGLINETRRLGPNANTGLALGAVVTTILASALIVVIKGGSEPVAAATTPTTSTAASPGADVFASAGCSGCHTLAAAGAAGTVGPNLDTVKPDEAKVQEVVTNGLGTGMPAFKASLSAKQISDVAKYVSENAGK
jgi:mono/diheme cytochrome c family protein